MIGSHRNIALAISAFFLAACSQEDGYEADLKKLTTYAQRDRIGEGPDQWLEKRNAFGEWEKLALVFAFADDYEGCVEIAALANEAFSQEYRCTPAN